MTSLAVRLETSSTGPRDGGEKKKKKEKIKQTQNTGFQTALEKVEATQRSHAERWAQNPRQTMGWSPVTARRPMTALTVEGDAGERQHTEAKREGRDGIPRWIFIHAEFVERSHGLDEGL